MVGDLIRASVLNYDMDRFWSAWERIRDNFDVREGRGRLKNNLFSRELRPPDLLINLIVDTPGMPSVMGEVQVRMPLLRSILTSYP